MRRNCQDELARRSLEKGRPQETFALEVEGWFCFLRQDGFEIHALVCAQADTSQFKGLREGDYLGRGSLPLKKVRAQRLMPADDFLETAVQCSNVQHTADPVRLGDEMRRILSGRGQ